MRRRATERIGAAAILIGAALSGCTTAGEPPPGRPDLPSSRPDSPAIAASAQPLVARSAPPSAAPVSPSAAASAALPAHGGEAETRADPARYPWLGDATLHVPDVAGALDDRFAPPPGFARIDLPEGSFGRWLRHLPLTRPRTPVTSHRGAVILPPDHENLAAVVAIDVGAGDLQQCADSVIRLHAEWQWSKGRRDESYRAASGFPLPFSRWAGGERVVADGNTLRWTMGPKPDPSHAAFRAYLDAVFAWANTGALARDTTAVALADLRPGDFVVQPGGPGHAVLVLDLAVHPDGRRALLLGQGFMPAQSFQVLRPSRESAWFLVDERGLRTPFWPMFAWSLLHRFPGS
ncbi:MAG: DUF4846 domain-containing protein [Byssovorax sp.]